MKKVLKVIAIMFVLAFSLLPLTACSKKETSSKALVLTVYNCEDYIDEDIFEDFSDWYEDLYGKRITINYITYDTNETMMTKIMNNDADVDVICTSEYAIQKLYNNGYLKKINKTNLDGDPIDAYINQDIYARTSSRFGAEFADYFVPYMYGTLGILYNKDIIDENGIDVEEAGWGLLWNNVNCPALDGKILMKDSIRDTFAAGVLYLKEQDKLPAAYQGYTSEQLINCTEDELIAAVKAALIDEKSVIKGYEVDFGKDDLIAERAYVDLAWSGDAMYAIEEAAEVDKNLDYYVPNSGANIWFDGWFIPTCSAHTDAATAFIEFMCLPEIGARNMVYVGYTSAVDKDAIRNDIDAINVINDAYGSEDPDDIDWDAIDEFFDWEVRYPLVNNPNYGMMQDYGDATTRMTIMWEEVKAATPTNRTPVWIISLIALGGIIVIFGAAIGTYIGLSKRIVYKKISNDK